MSDDGTGVAVGDSVGVALRVEVGFEDGCNVGDGFNVGVGFGVTIVGFGVDFGVVFGVIFPVGFTEGVGFEDDFCVSPQPAKTWVKNKHSKRVTVIELLNFFRSDIAFPSLIKNYPVSIVFRMKMEPIPSVKNPKARLKLIAGKLKITAVNESPRPENLDAFFLATGCRGFNYIVV